MRRIRAGEGVPYSQEKTLAAVYLMQFIMTAQMMLLRNTLPTKVLKRSGVHLAIFLLLLQNLALRQSIFHLDIITPIHFMNILTGITWMPQLKKLGQ